MDPKIKWEYLSNDGHWAETNPSTYGRMTFDEFKDKIISMGFIDARIVKV